ncbi:MAG: VWA domain-containing protein [Bryobacteraceae bacterium]
MLALAAAGGQAQKPSTEDPGAVFHSDTRLVVCNTAVVDKEGHLVTNLPRQAFTVYENGVKQTVAGFKREDVPVSMGLIIDNSGSMRERRAQVEAAALALVRDSNPGDEVFIVNFNDEVYLDNPPGKAFTSDIGEMEAALRRIDSRGGTAMRDAIAKSIDWLKKAHRDKKVLIVVTDGNDNYSSISLADLLKMAQRSEVLIYSVGLLASESRSDARAARQALEALASATGGEAYFPKELAEVDRIAHLVAHDIRGQYAIQYSPLNAAMDGSYRKIKITVNAPGRPTVRTRSGYYATPERQVPAGGAAFQQP